MIPFPAKVLDQHAAVLGKTGAGKSSAMRVVVEHLLDHNKRVCVIDPKGDWFGLQFSADGKSAGYPVITFGDFKGDNYKADVPVNEHSGKHVAELITSGNRPAVIGFRGWFTSHMTNFWVEFAKTLFHSNEGELYLIIDEAQNFAPKGSLKGIEGKAGTGLHWTNRLLAEGRGLGINIWVGSQRPQKVHNDTLDGCETLIAMRTVHPAARGALATWMKGAGDKESEAKILSSIGEMPRGEAWVWSPEIGFGPKQVAFPMFATFDSFAPPQLQKKVSAKTWADVDLDEVKEKLASVIKEAEAKDPAKLRAKIAQLESELRKREGQTKTVVETKIEKVEVPVLKDSQIARLDKLFGKFVADAAPIKEAIAKIKFANTEPRPVSPSPAVAKRVGAAEGPARDGHKPLMRNRQPALASPTGSTAGDTISGGMRRMMIALAQRPGLSKKRLGVRAGLSSRSGTFGTYLGRLRSNGWVNGSQDAIQITQSGIEALGEFNPLPEGRALYDYWRNELGQSGAGRMLEVLFESYPNSLTKAELGERANISFISGTFGTYLGRLRSLELISGSGELKASDEFFQ